jgi:hypothetical protein
MSSQLLNAGATRRLLRFTFVYFHVAWLPPSKSELTAMMDLIQEHFVSTKVTCGAN